MYLAGMRHHYHSSRNSRVPESVFHCGVARTNPGAMVRPRGPRVANPSMGAMIVLGMVGVAVLGVAFFNRGLLTGGRLTGKGGSEDEKEKEKEKEKDTGKLLVVPVGGLAAPESTSQSVLLDAGGAVFSDIEVYEDGIIGIDAPNTSYTLRSDEESGNLIFKAEDPLTFKEFLVVGLKSFDPYDKANLRWRIIYKNQE